MRDSVKLTHAKASHPAGILGSDGAGMTVMLAVLRLLIHAVVHKITHPLVRAYFYSI